jgi:hypothetical protein
LRIAWDRATIFLVTPALVKGAALAVMLTAAAAVYAEVQQRNENPQSTVLIFLSVDCPVSNRYAPEIQRLYRTFASRGLRFELVYPNPADTPDAIRRHVTDYDLPDVTVRDVDGKIARLAGATITPEAAVFDRNGELAYRGRIDDRFVIVGRERPAATVHDLRDALDSVLKGARIPQPRTQAVGCFIADFK